MNSLQVGQRVRVHGHHDPRMNGRTGTVARIPECCFEGWVFVTLDMTPRERIQKTRMIAVNRLGVIDGE